MPEKEVLDVRQAAEFLNLHAWTVYRYFRRGLIPGQKIGTRIRFSRKALEKFLSGFNKPKSA